MISEQSGFFSRLGQWLKGNPPTDAGPVMRSVSDSPPPPEDNHAEGGGNHTESGNHDLAPVHPVEASRGTFLRPWAKRDAAIGQLQDGFNALTGLMTAVRDTLDKQNQRQDEMMQILGNLPEVLKAIPESGAAQIETLRAVTEEVKQQNVQSAKLGEILQKVADTGSDQREMLDALRERVENLNEQDRNIAEGLTGVGSAMQSVSHSSQTSAQVLEQMRDNINAREGELQRILTKQGARYTTMLAIAIFLSIAALVAVCIMGYLVITKGK
jgi:ABC-type transporter Mla subunit MlaD